MGTGLKNINVGSRGYTQTFSLQQWACPTVSNPQHFTNIITTTTERVSVYESLHGNDITWESQSVPSRQITSDSPHSFQRDATPGEIGEFSFVPCSNAIYDAIKMVNKVTCGHRLDYNSRALLPPAGNSPTRALESICRLRCGSSC